MSSSRRTESAFLVNLERDARQANAPSSLDSLPRRMARTYKYGRHPRTSSGSLPRSSCTASTRATMTMHSPSPGVRTRGGCLPRPSYVRAIDHWRLTWHHGSCFLTTSKDMTAKLYTLHPVQGFRPKTFAGHKDHVLGAYFSTDGRTVSSEPVAEPAASPDLS